MKISLNWLKEFVDVPAELRDLKANLTRIGLGVESFARVGDDWVLDIEVTTNRPDCLSHYGMAREVATAYRKPLKRLEYVVKELGPPTAGEVSIEIADPTLCARYCSRVIKHVQVKPSPAWLVRRLEGVGVRPINNVADATNYVLMELGHPLHAFDLDHLRGRRVIVRRARAGEPLRTLDGVERQLTSENLVIADAERPVALAGVIGGQESEISSSTRMVLLESAWFEPVSIRRTAKAHGMHTEASHRFERGADIEMATQALDRVTIMIAELAGGQILKGMLDVYPQPKPRENITLRRAEILRILGAEVPWEDVEHALRGLGFHTERRGTEGWRVTPPSHRLDVTREVDLIEEVARHYGYDRLPARVRSVPPRVERDVRRERELTVSATLVSLGYREIITYSMVDPAENARFTDRPPVLLANPLSQEASALRSTPIPGMLHALRWNLDRGQSDLRLFEIGKTYTAVPGNTKGLPDERWVLTLGATGFGRFVPDRRDQRQATVPDRERRLDFFDLKGDLARLWDVFDIRDIRFDSTGCGYYEAGLGGCFADANGTLAVFGHVSREIARDYKLRQAVWLAEVDLERLLAYSLRVPAFRPYSKFPAVERDFSLILPDEVHYTQIAEALSTGSKPLIAGVHPVDLFRGGSIPNGHYSLLLRFTFNSLDHTLTNEEVDELCQGVLGALEPLGVRLRS